jgi:hypothetical protein
MIVSCLNDSGLQRYTFRHVRRMPGKSVVWPVLLFADAFPFSPGQISRERQQMCFLEGVEERLKGWFRLGRTLKALTKSTPVAPVARCMGHHRLRKRVQRSGIGYLPGYLRIGDLLGEHGGCGEYEV